jgi:signal transduction histidine kinase
MNVLTSDICSGLQDAGCPLAPAIEERLRFETLVTELSAKFVNVPASQVDSQIESGLRQIVEFLQIDQGGLVEVLSDQNQLVNTHSYHTTGAAHVRFVLDEELPWYTRKVYEGKIVRFRSLPDDLPPDAVHEREQCNRVGLKAQVMIPLKVNDVVVGAIAFGSFRGHRDWPDDLIERLHLVGEIFSSALARKRADEALRDREHSLQRAREGLRSLAAELLHAQEEERRRIAREMHDDWTQRLALLNIDTAKLEKQLGTQEDALQVVRAMREQLLSLAEDVHGLSRQLHPSILDDLGLVEALRSECASFTKREEITVDYRPAKLPANLPKDVAICIYRVAQEALRNVAKHAGVAKVSLTLAVDGSDLVLRIQDQGTGFDMQSARLQPGIGLASMSERVRLVDGTFSVTSAPAQGTTIEVSVPLAGNDP